MTQGCCCTSHLACCDALHRLSFVLASFCVKGRLRAHKPQRAHPSRCAAGRGRVAAPWTSLAPVLCCSGTC
eukprot:360679-Chlamydomonas_euryale.AAC.3